MEQLVRGTQIIYTPPHLKKPTGLKCKFGYPNGSQPGFVTSGPTAIGDYFCRYWLIEDGKPIRELRTKANSENTPLRSLTVPNGHSITFPVPPVWVEEALKEFC